MLLIQAIISCLCAVHVYAQNSFSDADATAVINITHSGECSHAYLDLRGVQVSTYQSAISFDSSKVRIEPKNPTIPGCMTFIAEVQVNKRILDATTQIELRMTGVPDPSVPTLPCGQPDKKKNNRCKCGHEEDTCTFCGLCHNLKRKEVRNVNLSRKQHRSSKHRALVINESIDGCGCDPVEPGTYTLSAEVCTPSEAELKANTPPEMQQRIAEGKPVGPCLLAWK